MGKIFLVGIGPGGKAHMTYRAVEAVERAKVVVGYKGYIELLSEFLRGKDVVSMGMGHESDRARIAVDRALAGDDVAVVSSGDPGVYAMGSALLEYMRDSNLAVNVEIIPGVAAANAAAALLGAPLGHDHAVISLSDLLTPWEAIEKRLVCAAEADFVIVLYNPKSKGREWQLKKAVELLRKYRASDTPVGIVKNAMREGEKVKVTTLGEMLEPEVDMFTTIIIGNSESFIHNGKIVTPRGYPKKG
ncbi:MAG: precorrin-3B C(17)-methyltransferase [Candidatus Hydrothermarchaeales archaeon]